MTAPDPKTVHEIAREHILYCGRDADDIGSYVYVRVGADLSKHEYGAWCSAIREAIRTAQITMSWPDEQQPAEATGGEQQPWPRTQRMPLALAGGRPQPWHHQAIAEYGAATGTELEPNPTISGGYTATQINWAITWWNERVEAEQAQDGAVEGAAEGIARFLTHFRGDSDDTVIEGLGRYCLTVGMLRAVLAERDALAAQVAGMPAELDMCTCGESRKVCELRTELDQAHAQLNAALAEREADTRAVARCQRAKAGLDAVPAMLALDARFADRIAALDDDAKATEKRTPEEWCTRYGVDIADPDGWRHRDAPAWDEPITLADFLDRARQSTARNVPSVDWKRIARDADVAGGKQ